MTWELWKVASNLRLYWRQPTAQMWHVPSFDQTFVNNNIKAMGTRLPKNWIAA